MNKRPAALVTGAGKRLGKAFAESLAERGYDIALQCFQSRSEAEAVSEELAQFGVECSVIVGNLRDVDALRNIMHAVIERFPNLSLLINSASSYSSAPIAETTPEMFDLHFETNLRGPFFLSQAFAQAVNTGQIINILDNKIAYSQFPYAAYLLSKKGLAEFTLMAALEFAPRLRVNAIAPGVVLL